MLQTLGDVLAVVGERWTLLVVREVAIGLRRFDEIREATDAPRAVLADRLKRLTVAGVLTTRSYRMPGSRERTEYTLTEAGLDLLPVLSAFSDWGQRHLGATALPDVMYCHGGCGSRVTARLLCACGAEVTAHGGLVATVNR